MKVILGSTFYDADPDTMRRQAQAMNALASVPDAVAVDLQWADAPPRRPWIRTVPVLRHDSTSVTGSPGRIKAIANESFDALAHVAERERARYFLYFNSDILITPQTTALVTRSGAQAYAFARMDFTPSGKEVGVLVAGFDAFAFEVGWWRANRSRFRPYILGEPCWDNVYAAILMCHGDGRLVNRDVVIKHEKHATVWGDGPFAQYNSFLASLDARYFTLWATYHAELVSARTAGLTSETDERALASRVFVWRRSPSRALWQAGRNVKAHVRYRRQRARWRMV